MDIFKYVIRTPWDSRVFGLDTFEITAPSEEVFKLVFNTYKSGHYTVKVDPLFSKKLLHDYGFYYCDTLIEPYCTSNNFVFFEKEGVRISEHPSINDLINICYGAFIHGRFHRDFNIDKNLADMRYILWLKDIYNSQSILELKYYDRIAGFWGFSNNKILLHALSEEYRGRGMAKYFWSVACKKLFDSGCTELVSSISISNVRVLNLYSSLGFKFRNPLDVYHLLLK